MVNYVFLSVYFYSVPNLRFNGYTENWQKYRTIELGQMQRGKSKHRPRDDEKLYGGAYPFIQTGDIKKANLYIKEYERTYSNYGLSQSKLWSKGTLCITIAANIAETAILGLNACFPDSVIGWISNEKITNNIFIKYYFDFYKTQLKRLSVGGAQENLNLDKLENVYFHIPTLPEQNDITNLLTKIDELIETQIKIINDLVLQKKCIISSLLKSVQDNEKIMLKDILFDYNIKTTINNEYPVLSSTASGMYLQSEYFNKEASSDNTIGYKIIPRGYCTYRSMSDTGLFTFNMQELVEKGIVSPAYPVFSANDDYINEFIILYLNNSSYIKKQILELKSGGTRFALPFSTLCTLKIPKLDKEKQLSLIKTITAFERKIENEEMLLKALHQQKNFLLNNMFI